MPVFHRNGEPIRLRSGQALPNQVEDTEYCRYSTFSPATLWQGLQYFVEGWSRFIKRTQYTRRNTMVERRDTRDEIFLAFTNNPDHNIAYQKWDECF